jgi:signal transduction histidine kinase
MEDLGERVRVSVHDHGPGIPENFRARIFGRFAQADSSLTRQKGGTGLGLAICKRLVELMEGRIGFADRATGGTVFYFELPKQAAA